MGMPDKKKGLEGLRNRSGRKGLIQLRIWRGKKEQIRAGWSNGWYKVLKMLLFTIVLEGRRVGEEGTAGTRRANLVWIGGFITTSSCREHSRGGREGRSAVECKRGHLVERGEGCEVSHLLIKRFSSSIWVVIGVSGAQKRDSPRKAFPLSLLISLEAR